ALTLRIGIDENDDAGMYSTETALQCASFTPVFLRQQANARIDMPNALNFGSCLITRAVVHNDDFNFTLVIGRYKSAQSFSDDFPFVVSSHHHTDRLRKIRRRSSLETVGQPDDDERADDHKRGCNNHKRPKEFFDTVKNAKSSAADETCQRLPILSQWRHDCITRRAKKRTQRYHAITACVQPIQNARERLDSLRAIATRVVQQDDTAVVPLLFHALKNGVRARLRPILWIDAFHDDHVIEIFSDLQRDQFA